MLRSVAAILRSVTASVTWFSPDRLLPFRCGGARVSVDWPIRLPPSLEFEPDPRLELESEPETFPLRAASSRDHSRPYRDRAIRLSPFPPSPTSTRTAGWGPGGGQATADRAQRAGDLPLSRPRLLPSAQWPPGLCTAARPTDGAARRPRLKAHDALMNLRPAPTLCEFQRAVSPYIDAVGPQLTDSFFGT